MQWAMAHGMPRSFNENEICGWVGTATTVKMCFFFNQFQFPWSTGCVWLGSIKLIFRLWLYVPFVCKLEWIYRPTLALSWRNFYGGYCLICIYIFSQEGRILRNLVIVMSSSILQPWIKFTYFCVVERLRDKKHLSWHVIIPNRIVKADPGLCLWLMMV